MGLSLSIERSVVAIDGDWRPALAALHLIALALLVAVTVAWGRHAGRRRVVASGFLMVLTLTAVYLLTFRPSDVPTDWITILHHGLELKSILHLYTLGAHAGMNF